MNLKEKISADLKSAMKEGDTVRRDTLRHLDSMIKNYEIEKKKRKEGLSESEVQEVISRAAKQRRESISQYESGGRAELAEKEKNELAILLGYLPEQLSEEKIREVVREIISEASASGKPDMGRIMGAAMAKIKGQAEGQMVKKIVEAELR